MSLPIYTHMYSHIYTHTCTHTNMCCKHTYPHTNMSCTHTHTHMHSYIHTYIYHTYIHTYAHHYTCCSHTHTLKNTPTQHICISDTYTPTYKQITQIHTHAQKLHIDTHNAYTIHAHHTTYSTTTIYNYLMLHILATVIFCCQKYVYEKQTHWWGIDLGLTVHQLGTHTSGIYSTYTHTHNIYVHIIYAHWMFVCIHICTYTTHIPTHHTHIP